MQVNRLHWLKSNYFKDMIGKVYLSKMEKIKIKIFSIFIFDIFYICPIKELVYIDI